MRSRNRLGTLELGPFKKTPYRLDVSTSLASEMCLNVTYRNYTSPSTMGNLSQRMNSISVLCVMDMESCVFPSQSYLTVSNNTIFTPALLHSPFLQASFLVSLR